MIDIQEWEYKSPNYSVEVQIMLLYLCQKWCLILYPGPTGNCYVSIGSAQQSQYINPPPPPASLSPHNHSDSTLCYTLLPPTGFACLGPRARGRVVILTVMPIIHYSVGNQRQASSCLQSDK